MIYQHSLIICLAEEQDIRGILAIQNECKLSVWSASQYREEIKKSSSLVVVARFEGKTIGFLATHLSKSLNLSEKVLNYTQADVLNFGIINKFQKQRIGTLLLEKFFALTARMNLEAVWLEVRESNLKAINFYQKKGFVKTQIRKNFYRDPLENAALMKLDLPVLP